MVKIFLDTANIDDSRGRLLGRARRVTTNPTLVAKTGRKWSEVIQDILALSMAGLAEVTTTQRTRLIKQGRQLANLHKNVWSRSNDDGGPQGDQDPFFGGREDSIRPHLLCEPGHPRREAGAKYVSPFSVAWTTWGQDGMQ